MKTLKIRDELHQRIRSYCRNNGTTVQYFAQCSLLEKLAAVDPAGIVALGQQLISTYDQTQPNPRTKARTKAQKRTPLAQKAQD